MTRKLLLTIALGTAAAVVYAGASTSLAVDLEGEDPTGVTATVIDVPECADLEDNDGDGKIDTDDPDCVDLDDDSEDPEGDDEGGQGNTTTTTPKPPADEGGTKDNGGKGTKGSGKGGSARSKPKQGGKGGTGGGVAAPKLRKKDGSPTKRNPTATFAPFGPAPIGVPNFVIDQFEIPPFLLPIYQACGTQYGIPWQVLASINRIETAFGTNLNVSSAGALGWMQFLPSSWRAYGVDANRDGRRDPYNPVDAICAAARYLKAAGAEESLRDAIFAYNHADWYVDEVLLYANQYAKLPDDLVGSLTGLTEGAHFPVAANARYADDISEREALRRSRTNRTEPGNAADVISDSPTRRGINIYSRVKAPVVAVNDGVIRRLGRNRRLGRFVVLEDAYGNRYTYAGLGRIAKVHPVAKERALGPADFELVRPGQDPAPAAPASAGRDEVPAGTGDDPAAAPAPPNTEEARKRLYALPERPANVDRAAASGQLDALLGQGAAGYESFAGRTSATFEFDPETMVMRPLRRGSRVVGGTVLGQIGRTGDAAPHVNFAIRPAGRGAPRIDPKPILDGWKLLETTAIYRAAGANPFGAGGASVGQVLLMSKAGLERRVLADPRIEIYSCGRLDIRTGQINRRVLAALEYLAERGYRLTITSLECGHSYLTSSGNVSAHSSGNAVDIAAVNGLPILGHQGRGSVTEAVIRDLIKLQGTMKPAQVISLMDLGYPSFVLADHDDHIHVGYTPPSGVGGGLGGVAQILRPEQWRRLIERLGEIDNPKVRAKPSDASLPNRRGSRAHRGE